MTTVISRALVTLGAAAGLTALATGIAAAHVVVQAPGAQQGGDSVLTFRVPDESDTASTTKLTVTLPGLDSAYTQTVQGWTAKFDKNDKNEYVTVTWTADPGTPGIAPGQFQLFPLFVDGLPKQDKLTFPAAQTYSNGTVVQWNQPTGNDGKEPEHPVPTITLAAGGDDMGAPAAAASTTSSDDTARWLGGIGLALGAVGALLGLGSVLRSRRS
jgi:uncharacterized protein YcnI